MAAEDHCCDVDTDVKSEEKSTEISQNVQGCFYQLDKNSLRIYIQLASKNSSSSNKSCSSKDECLFVVDYSSSMGNSWGEVQKAVRYFVDNSNKRTRNKTHFIVYAGEARMSNYNEILSMEASGWTDFGKAFTQIETFLDRLNKKHVQNGSSSNKVVNVIFMTDGQDTSVGYAHRPQARLEKFQHYINNSVGNIKVVIHCIGFTSDHDRVLLEQLCKSSQYKHGVYRFADNDNGNYGGNGGDGASSLKDKFEEMFDFMAMSNSVTLTIDNRIKVTADINRLEDNTREIDLIVDLNQYKCSHNNSGLFPGNSNKNDKNVSNNNTSDSITVAVEDGNVYGCQRVECDELFSIRQAEMMEINNEEDLMQVQSIIMGVKAYKIKNRAIRNKVETLQNLIQLKLDKYFKLFNDINRGLISRNDTSVLSQLNSLRYETKFSKARLQRTMNRRAVKNMNQFKQIENELKSIEFPPSDDIMKQLFGNDSTICKFKCLLSNDTIFDIMTESYDNIMVFTLNVDRPEHLIDAPLTLEINKYLSSKYSFEAIKDATRFAIDEHGQNKAFGGFKKFSKFDPRNNHHQADEQEKIGFFRGCDGYYPNGYLPLYLNSEHFKRVKILIKPILGYLFTLDPLGFQANQFIALYYILGHMLCIKNNKQNKQDYEYYSGEWFEWLVKDFGKLCFHLLPTLSKYIKGEVEGYLGGILCVQGYTIKSGNILNEWLTNENMRFSKSVIQNQLVLIGLDYCYSMVNHDDNDNSDEKEMKEIENGINIDRDEFEIKFIQELWRRNFASYYKNKLDGSISQKDVNNALDSLLFDFSKLNSMNGNDIDKNTMNKILSEMTQEEIWVEMKEKNIVLNSYEEILVDFDVIAQDQEQKQEETQQQARLDEINRKVEQELLKIENKNRFVSTYMKQNDAILGRDIGVEKNKCNFKLRWLMVIQALRNIQRKMDTNSNNNSSNNLCAFDCLILNKFSLKECLHEYIETKNRSRSSYITKLAQAKERRDTRAALTTSTYQQTMSSQEMDQLLNDMVGNSSGSQYNYGGDDSSDKTRLSLVMTGHFDSGKSTTCGRLLYELGLLSDDKLNKLRKEARELGKESFLFAFCMDVCKDERERGVSIEPRFHDFFTKSYHYSLIDVPGQRNFVKNMITGASQADVAVLMIPANKGGFENAIAKGNHRKGEFQGQSRVHARLCYLMGIDQMIVCVNKMDDKTVNYDESRFNQICVETKQMLTKIGYKTKRIPFIPISGFCGDNLCTQSKNMVWYKGFKVKIKKHEITGVTLLDALETVIRKPKRAVDNKAFRMPVAQHFLVRGVGHVFTGRVEQGKIIAGVDVRFYPSGIKGKAFSIETHHKHLSQATCGDNIGINVKGLSRDNMPQIGDIMCIDNLKYDPNPPRQVTKFSALVFVQDHPGQLKCSKPDKKYGGFEGGYMPIVYVRTAKVACRMISIEWKMGKNSTNNIKVENASFIESGDQAQVTFVPEQALSLCPFDECKPLGRIACIDHNQLVMMGKVLSVEYKSQECQEKPKQQQQQYKRWY